MEYPFGSESGVKILFKEDGGFMLKTAPMPLKPLEKKDHNTHFSFSIPRKENDGLSKFLTEVDARMQHVLSHQNKPMQKFVYDPEKISLPDNFHMACSEISETSDRDSCHDNNGDNFLSESENDEANNSDNSDDSENSDDYIKLHIDDSQKEELDKFLQEMDITINKLADFYYQPYSFSHENPIDKTSFEEKYVTLFDDLPPHLQDINKRLKQNEKAQKEIQKKIDELLLKNFLTKESKRPISEKIEQNMKRLQARDDNEVYRLMHHDAGIIDHNILEKIKLDPSNFSLDFCTFNITFGSIVRNKDGRCHIPLLQNPNSPIKYLFNYKLDNNNLYFSSSWIKLDRNNIFSATKTPKIFAEINLPLKDNQTNDFLRNTVKSLDKLISSKDFSNKILPGEKEFTDIEYISPMFDKNINVKIPASDGGKFFEVDTFGTIIDEKSWDNIGDINSCIGNGTMIQLIYKISYIWIKPINHIMVYGSVLEMDYLLYCNDF